MRVFQSTYVGRNDFPKSLPDFLLQQWFTLNARDRRATCSSAMRRRMCRSPIRMAGRDSNGDRAWPGAKGDGCCGFLRLGTVVARFIVSQGLVLAGMP
jgi:hypothetical protein